MHRICFIGTVGAYTPRIDNSLSMPYAASRR
jgi:hypothetical protein